MYALLMWWVFSHSFSIPYIRICLCLGTLKHNSLWNWVVIFEIQRLATNKIVHVYLDCVCVMPQWSEITVASVAWTILRKFWWKCPSRLYNHNHYLSSHQLFRYYMPWGCRWQKSKELSYFTTAHSKHSKIWPSHTLHSSHLSFEAFICSKALFCLRIIRLMCVPKPLSCQNGE